MDPHPLSKIGYGIAIDAVGKACFGYSLKRLESLKNGSTIAHYTTAETALQIIKNKTFWLRNAALMNDFSELQYGDESLEFSLNDESVRARMIQVVDAHYPGLTREIAETWNVRKAQAKRLTYIGSFSEIDLLDPLGRLSMWRAYGGNAGVALCINPELLDSDSSELSVFHSPVLYGPKEKLRDELLALLDRLSKVQDQFASISRETVSHFLNNAIRYAVLSFKHPGFEEEREWRMIYCLDETVSPYIEHVAVAVRGIPQVVCQVSLRDIDGLNMPELDISKIFKRIIIGPCEFPDQIRMALLKAFHDHEVEAPDIVISNIPLRQH